VKSVDIDGEEIPFKCSKFDQETQECQFILASLPGESSSKVRVLTSHPRRSLKGENALMKLGDNGKDSVLEFTYGESTGLKDYLYAESSNRAKL
jgi:hypothetical protein